MDDMQHIILRVQKTVSIKSNDAANDSDSDESVQTVLRMLTENDDDILMSSSEQTIPDNECTCSICLRDAQPPPDTPLLDTQPILLCPLPTEPATPSECIDLADILKTCMRRENYWFSDGDVILKVNMTSTRLCWSLTTCFRMQADNSVYNVHTSILSNHSDWFREVLHRNVKCTYIEMLSPIRDQELESVLSLMYTFN